jgi:hypothetical protein
MDAILDFLQKTSTPKILLVAGLILLGVAILRKVKWIDLDQLGRQTAYASGVTLIVVGLVMDAFVSGPPWAPSQPPGDPTPTPVTTTPGAVTPTPTPDGAPYEQMTLTDDFSQNQVGSYPANWRQQGQPLARPQVSDFKGSGAGYRVFAFPLVQGVLGDMVSIYSRARCSQYVAQTKINFQSESDSAGLVFAWRDSDNYMAFFVNVYWQNSTFVEHAKGVERAYLRSWNRTVPLAVQREYVLKVEASSDRTINRVSGTLTAPGEQPSILFEARNVETITGQIGVGTGGPNQPKVYFDDFSVSGTCRLS